MVENVEIGSIGNNCDDEKVEKSLPKNLNRAKAYITLDARQAFIQLKQIFTIAPILRFFDLEYHI